MNKRAFLILFEVFLLIEISHANNCKLISNKIYSSHGTIFIHKNSLLKKSLNSVYFLVELLPQSLFY